MTFAALLPQRCSIYRGTVGNDQYGHRSKGYALVYSNIPCRLDRIGNFTSTLSQTPTGQTARNEYVGFFLANQDIQTGDRIQINGETGYLYVTPSIPVYDANTLHHKEVYLAVEEQ